MLKVNELFSGIGAFRKALINLGVEHEVVGIAEIDKYAIKSYEAMYGQVHNYGDISKSFKLDYADMWTYGFPCQDISVAGKQAGIERHTRSGLLYQVQRLLEVAYQYNELPKYLILENVKNLVGKKFRADFDEWLNYLNELGYNNYWKVLNAKNYGVPQNRERVFVISIRKDIDTGYEFPMPFDNGIRLKDVLEDEVDERFYISNEKVEKLINSTFMQEKKRIQETDTCGRLLARDYKDPKCVCIPCITPDRVEKRQNGRRFKEDGDPSFTLTSQDRHGVLQVGMLDIKGNEQVRRVYAEEGCSPTLNTMQGGNRQPKVMVKEATKQGYAIAEEGDSINIQFPNSTTRRGRVGKSVPQTLETSCNQAVILKEKVIGTLAAHNSDAFGNGFMEDVAKTLKAEKHDISVVYEQGQNYRIRKLTPKECWRLMGFSDSDFQKCVDEGISNSQLYKQAGNSIVVDVLFYMLKNLLKEASK